MTITIDEAIIILEKELPFFKRDGHTDKESAAKLDIEALKMVKKCRLDRFTYVVGLMPGETES